MISERYNQLMRMHPLIRQDFTFPTTQIEQLANALSHWLDINVTGVIVSGEPRVGKTWALQWLRHNVSSYWDEDIPIIQFSMVSLEDPEISFLELFLREMGSPFVKGTKRVIWNRTRDLMLHMSEAYESNLFLVFIDEAQKLTNHHYDLLVDISNILDEKHIRLVTLLVGQPELESVYGEVVERNRRHIGGRFMKEKYVFKGLLNAEDLALFLRSFDLGERFPLDSGVSFTEFFVPDAFLSGWRLEKQAEKIWMNLNEYSVETGAIKLTEFAMTPTVALMSVLLRELSEEDGQDLILTDKQVQNAIRSAIGSQMKFYLDNTH